MQNKTEPKVLSYIDYFQILIKFRKDKKGVLKSVKPSYAKLPDITQLPIITKVISSPSISPFEKKGNLIINENKISKIKILKLFDILFLIMIEILTLKVTYMLLIL